MFSDSLHHKDWLEITHMWKFYKELGADDVKSQLFSDFAIKKRVKKFMI